jgi:hypothetical protein
LPPSGTPDRLTGIRRRAPLNVPVRAACCPRKARPLALMSRRGISPVSVACCASRRPRPSAIVSIRRSSAQRCRCSAGLGLFVPKPSTGVGCQDRCMPELGRGVHRCPPASVVGRGGSYSVGYSASSGLSRASPEGAVLHQTATAQVGRWSVTCGDTCRLDRQLRCVPQMSHSARLGLRTWPSSGPYPMRPTFRRRGALVGDRKGRSLRGPLSHCC